MTNVTIPRRPRRRKNRKDISMTNEPSRKIARSGLYRLKGGRLSFNYYGYEMADLICQQCVAGRCEYCIKESHPYQGYSACLCNNGNGATRTLPTWQDEIDPATGRTSA